MNHHWRGKVIQSCRCFKRSRYRNLGQEQCGCAMIHCASLCSVMKCALYSRGNWCNWYCCNWCESEEEDENTEIEDKSQNVNVILGQAHLMFNLNERITRYHKRSICGIRIVSVVYQFNITRWFHIFHIEGANEGLSGMLEPQAPKFPREMREIFEALDTWPRTGSTKTEVWSEWRCCVSWGHKVSPKSRWTSWQLRT